MASHDLSMPLGGLQSEGAVGSHYFMDSATRSSVKAKNSGRLVEG